MGNIWSKNTKTWQNIKKYSDFSEGDELCYFYFLRYRWGIVTKKHANGDFEMIGYHLKAIDNTVRREKYNFHRDEISYQKASYNSFQLSNREAVQNALARLGEDEYNRRTNFARAFTRWCKTGKRDLFSQYHEIRTKEEVTIADLKKYDHVVLLVQNHYHHGIITDTQPINSKLTIVHLSDFTGTDLGNVRPNMSTLLYRTGPILRVQYTTKQPIDQIQKRIDLVLETTSWVENMGGQIHSGTCEQFATWILTGNIVKTQVSLNEVISDIERKEKEKMKNKPSRCVSESDNAERLPVENVQDFLQSRLGPLKDIGMTSTNEQIYSFMAPLIADSLRRAEAGVTSTGKMPIVCFIGNIGTGKSHVAKEFAEAIFHLGYVMRPHSEEVNVDELLGETEATTITTTNERINDLRGGTMVISNIQDVAKHPHGDTFMKVLNASINDDPTNDRPAYVFTGNSNAVDFVKTQKILSEHIKHFITFEDYSPENLASILDMKLKEKRLEFEGQKQWLTQQISFHFSTEQRSSANAKLCEHILSEARRNLDKRVAQELSGPKDIDTDRLMELNKGDIEMAMELVKTFGQFHR